MSNLSTRRKLKMTNSYKRSNEDNPSALSFNSRNLNDEPRNDKKIIQELSLMLKEQRQKRQQLEGHLEIHQRRTANRQKQFHLILESTHKEVKKFITDTGTKSSTVSDILKIFSSIVEKFQQSNEAAQTFIANRYSENLGMMERRIFKILENYEIQISKNKRLSEQNYRQIKQDIQKVLILAKNIQDQNVRLRKTVEEMKFKNSLLSQERDLLIQEIVKKKKAISRYYFSEKNNQKIHVNSQKKSINMLNPQMREISATIDVPKFLGQPSIDVSDFQASRSINLHNKNSRFSSLSSQNKKFISGSLMKKKTKDLDSTSQKTIEHLKTCLNREKQKNLQLGKIVTKIQDKNSQINDTIFQILQQTKADNGDKQKSIQTMLKSQKLFQTIRNLKKRLSSCEKPSMYWGWSQTDTDQLLELNEAND